MIAKGLTSVKSSKEQPEVLAKRARELESRLSQWHSNMPSSLRAELPLAVSFQSSERRQYHLIYIHFAYYGSIIAIHSVFAHPWYLSTRGHNQGPEVKEQVHASTNAVVQASRQIVLATKHIDVRGPWPAWLAPTAICIRVHRLTDQVNFLLSAVGVD